MVLKLSSLDDTMIAESFLEAIRANNLEYVPLARGWNESQYIVIIELTTIC